MRKLLPSFFFFLPADLHCASILPKFFSSEKIVNMHYVQQYITNKWYFTLQFDKYAINLYFTFVLLLIIVTESPKKMNNTEHIRVTDLRGGKGDATPLLYQNFIIFMQFSGNISQIIGWAPPNRGLVHLSLGNPRCATA